MNPKTPEKRTENPTSPEKPTESSLEHAYERYVAELRHEDSLINHRLTWLLVFEGFLFAGTGAERTTTAFVYVLGSAGIAAAISVWVSIRAAINAWNCYHKNLCNLPSGQFDDVLFPQRARSSKAIKWGHIAPQVMAWLFAPAWSIVILLSLLGHFRAP